MREHVFDNSVTGRPEEILSTVLRKISAHTRENVVRGFKIGITNNPPRRRNEHKRNYDEMILSTDPFHAVLFASWSAS